jgi:hypothetical protein
MREDLVAIVAAILVSGHVTPDINDAVARAKQLIDVAAEAAPDRDEQEAA